MISGLHVKNSLGFTLLELLVSITIISLVAIIAFPFMQSSVGKTELQSAIWELQDNLRRAQSQSINGKGNTNWSIHFDTTSYTLFEGNTYSGVDPDNIDYDLSSSITITDVSLNGGGNDIRFVKSKGRTDDYGSVTLTDSSTNDTASLSVTRQGKIGN
jgi:prepilin-type N-terminal cleavage/methylation domain-containing protein